MDLPPGAVEGENITCGYVTVPEDRANPAPAGQSSRTIRLAVAVIPSAGTDPAADPLLMLAGGPGDSALTRFVPLLAMPGMEGLGAERDIVLVEQRGTRYSTPFLQCNEMLELKLDLLDENLGDEEEEARKLAAWTACWERFVASGVNLAAYNSVESAADVSVAPEGADESTTAVEAEPASDSSSDPAPDSSSDPASPEQTSAIDELSPRVEWMANPRKVISDPEQALERVVESTTRAASREDTFVPVSESRSPDSVLAPVPRSSVRAAGSSSTQRPVSPARESVRAPEFERSISVPTHQQVAAQVLRESSGKEGVSTAGSSVGVDRIGWSGQPRRAIIAVEPEFPDVLRREGQEVIVDAQILVSPSGNVVSVSVLDSSGYTEVDSIVERTLRRWLFEKSSEDGNDTGFVSFRFELRAME